MTRGLYSKIAEHIEEKHAKQTMDIVGSFPLLTDVQDDVMLGNFSWYYMRQKRKEILRPHAIQFPTFVSTPSELARAYIEVKYEKQRATREQIVFFRERSSAPLYASPHRYSNAFYIDIRSAFWQILQIVGWDCDYNPGVWLAKGQSMEDFPFAQVKLSRNCLVTCGLPSEANFWSGSERKFKRVKTFNRHINLGIWRLVMDVLHCIAWDCIAAGAIYAHTDGYICSSERVMAVQDALSSWGLESRIKAQGETIVYGVGAYKIGKTVTKNPKIHMSSFDGLILPEWNKWLKSRFRAHAERTHFIWENLEWERDTLPGSISSLPQQKSLTLSQSVAAASEMRGIRISSSGVQPDEAYSLISDHLLHGTIK